MNRLPDAARLAARRQETAQRRADRHQAEADEREARFHEIHRDLCRRFRVGVPRIPIVMDVLANCEVGDDDEWWWQGAVNNHGAPRVRLDRPQDHQWYFGEPRKRPVQVTVARLLAIAFEVIKPTDYGLLQAAAGQQLDVNPWHRTFGRTDKPLHGPGNFEQLATAL